jgi:hypothetical protein
MNDISGHWINVDNLLTIWIIGYMFFFTLHHVELVGSKPHVLHARVIGTIDFSISCSCQIMEVFLCALAITLSIIL